jgi:ribosomal protein S18 acetylase RimI-like enzyme
VGPAGAALDCHLEPADADAALALLEGTYWNEGIPPEALRRAHLSSSAWVGARDERGALIASARALSDVGKRAWIYDVIVAPRLRGRGVGEAVVRLLLDHPAVRGAREVRLGTRDAQALYARLGFEEARLSPRPYPTTEMVLRRP